MSDQVELPDGMAALSETIGRWRHLLPPVDAAVLARIDSTRDEGGAAYVEQAGLPALVDPVWEALAPREARDRALGCLLGLAIGGGWGAGLCVAEGLLAAGDVDIEDLLIRLEEGAHAGEGVLPRVAPVAVFARGDGARAEVLAARQARATDPAMEAVDACRLLGAMLVDALNGADRETATRPRVMALCPAVLRISGGEWRTMERDALAGDRTVPGALEAALWAVWQAGDFPEAIEIAAEMGPGVVAVAGALAGALCGMSGIPLPWLAEREAVEVVADALWERGTPTA